MYTCTTYHLFLHNFKVYVANTTLYITFKKMVLIICVEICPHWYIIYSVYFFKLFIFYCFIMLHRYCIVFACLHLCFYFLTFFYWFWGLHQVFAAAHRLSNCGVHALEHTGSAVVALRLSFNVASGILVPQPGIEPCPLHCKADFLTTGPPEKSHSSFILWAIHSPFCDYSTFFKQIVSINI